MVRLFKTIDLNSNKNSIKIAKKIIENEKNKGHLKVAKKLEEVLEKNFKKISFDSQENKFKRVVSSDLLIPKDKRNSIPLATRVERENLRHDMVLPLVIEKSIQRIEKEYVARERLAHFGLKPRKKVLFFGSPGCGKSMAAERIAWNIGLPFLKVRFEAIMSSYLGESAANLRKLFDSLNDYPCVLLLDEFDFIAKTRSAGHDVGEVHRLVNILLNLLEDYDAPGILIATTNFEGMLDKALFRRFDDILEIPKPGIIEIVELIKNTLSSINLSKSLDIESAAKKMKGLSAAIVVKIANDAAKNSVIDGSNVLKNKHIQTALKEHIDFSK